MWEMNELQRNIWERKYQHNGETFDEWLDRVSNGDKNIRELIEKQRFLFGGRILSNRGLQKEGKKVTYSNCYVISTDDSIEDIYQTCSDLARTFSYGGGVGVDISKLRPIGSEVNNTAKTTSGACSFMPTFSQVAETIGQNGRRAALMLSMDVNHPEIKEFINMKTNTDQVTKANISVRVDDEFMDKVVHNKTHVCSYELPNGEVVNKVYKARDLFKLLCENNYDWGEPGILYWDTIEDYNILSEDDEFEYAGVNPCLTGDTLIQTTEGEIPIKDLVGKQPYVYCMDEDGKLIIKQASKVWKTRENAELVKINHHRGSLICTPDHEIYTKNRGWVKAKDLKPKDQLNGLGRSMKDEQHCCVKLTTDKKYHAEHRFVAGFFEDITTNQDVHHINGNPLDNRWSNLEVLNHHEHSIVTNEGHVCWNERDELGRFIKTNNPKKGKSLEVNKKVAGKNFKVINVEQLDYKEDVYDMTVPEVHNFVANSIIVHNCAEEPLPNGGSCLLGSFNLSAYVIDGEFDIELFKKDIPVVVKAMNDVLDEGLPLHPLEIQRKTVRDYRQIGIGIMGIGDMLIKLGLRYGDEESLELCDVIGYVLADSSLKASSLLAKEEGAFPKCKVDKILKSSFIRNNASEETKELIKKYGLRNSQLLTIAPTGTLSTMLGITGGIEPIFATHYTRKTESLHDKDVYYKVYTPIVEEYMKSHKLEDDKDLPDYFVTAQTLDFDERIDMQSVWQKHIDASISSTINLPHDAKVEDVQYIYIKAWKKGLKGVTIFRDGCKRMGVLTMDDKKEEPIKENELKRGEWAQIPDDTIYVKRKVYTGCGKLNLFIGYSPSENRLVEFYTKRSGNGGCEHNIDSTVISMSGMLRLGGTLDNVKKAFEGCGACNSFARARCTGKKLSPGKSCATAILNMIEKTIQEINNDQTKNEVEKKEVNMSDDLKVLNDKVQKANETKQELLDKGLCPECKEPLDNVGGCVTCNKCGFSRCE